MLFQLLGFLVDAGKGIVQTTFEKLADQNPNQPVGTTMALIEQGMVVFSSIHSRLHSSMARCLKILHRINSAYLTQDDVQAQVAGLKIEPSDFDGPMDVIPVSDPSIFSDTQRFAQTQAIVQRAGMLPQLYDIRKVEEMFLRNLKVPVAEVLLPKPGSEDKDPTSENIEATMGQPIFVLPKQDHLQHIMTHMAFLKSNLFGANPAIIKTYLFPMATHLRDHLLNYYMVETHQAVMKAKRQGMIQDDPTQQTQIIMQVQQFIEQQLSGFGEELAQITQQAQQFAPPAGPPMPQDNSLQVAQINAQVQQSALQQRSQSDQAKLQQQSQVSQQKMQLDQAKLQQDAQLKQAEFQAKQQAAALDLQKEQMRQQAADQRAMQEIQARQQMNEADNQTALQLAQAELLSGENFSVSTGTGINPNP